MNGLINTSSNSTVGCVWRNSLLHLCIHKTPFLASCIAGPGTAAALHCGACPYTNSSSPAPGSGTCQPRVTAMAVAALSHCSLQGGGGAQGQEASTEGCAKPKLLCLRLSSPHNSTPPPLGSAQLSPSTAPCHLPKDSLCRGQCAHPPVCCKFSGAQTAH